MSIRAVSSLSPVFIAMCPFSSKSGSVSEDHSLRFPADKYTLKTITVRTSGGEIPVHYRSYLHIPYVADPLDRDYQSLNVDVPVKVDGKAICP